MVNPLANHPRPEPLLVAACRLIGCRMTDPLTLGNMYRFTGSMTFADQTKVMISLIESSIDPYSREETLSFMVVVGSQSLGRLRFVGLNSRDYDVHYTPIFVFGHALHPRHSEVLAALQWRIQRLGHPAITVESPIEKSEWEQRYAH